MGEGEPVSLETYDALVVSAKNSMMQTVGGTNIG
jgi:hypothetical protein